MTETKKTFSPKTLKNYFLITFIFHVFEFKTKKHVWKVPCKHKSIKNNWNVKLEIQFLKTTGTFYAVVG